VLRGDLFTDDVCDLAPPSDSDTTVALRGGNNGNITLAIPGSLGSNFPFDVADALSATGRFTRTTL